MENENDLAKRILTIKKILNAPVELVWEAWTQPEHIAQWWGPKGMKTSVVEHNFKVGGKWKYAMKMPDGRDFISEGVYLAIVKPERIFTTADFRPMTEGVELRAMFKANGDKTDFTFSVIHATQEYRDQQEKMGFYNGWGSTFDRLETFVRELSEKKQKRK